MLIRVVKMTFRNDEINTFLHLFEERKHRIKNFEGCKHLELWQDRLHPNIFFTYSHWANMSNLDNYRSSPFFKETWQLTKALFSAPPEAWSVNKV